MRTILLVSIKCVKKEHCKSITDFPTLKTVIIFTPNQIYSRVGSKYKYINPNVLKARLPEVLTLPILFIDSTVTFLPIMFDHCNKSKIKYHNLKQKIHYTFTIDAFCSKKINVAIYSSFPPFFWAEK